MFLLGRCFKFSYFHVGINHQICSEKRAKQGKKRQKTIKSFRPDFTSNFRHGLAFGTPKFYIVPNGKINHELVNLSYDSDMKSCLRPDFTSKLVHRSAIGTPKFYIVPYDKIKHELVNLSDNCDAKSGLRV